MLEPPDIVLLRQYAEQASEAAFAELVKRHVNLVYSAALRKTRNPHAAEEITQAAFILLAKKARVLGKNTILSGWLYQATRLIAANFLRREIRRVRREQEACMQSSIHETESEIWVLIEPLLEEAMGRLNQTELNAIVLRFFEGKSFQEIGAALGGSENAAKKRVGRALDKLRKFFAKRGVGTTTAVIAGLMAVNSVQAAPPALANSVSMTGFAKGAAARVSSMALVKAALLAAKLKMIIATAAGVALLSAGGYWLITRHKPPGRPPLTYIGTGLYLGRNQQTRKFEVRRIFPNSPAEKAGLVPGLVLNKVNEALAETNNIKQLSELLNGPAGTRVTVEVIDTKGATNDVELVRELFVNKSTNNN